MSPQEEVTTLLAQWSSGDRSALDRLMPLVYEELRVVAANRLRSEPVGHTLQATALVNEAFLRMAGSELDLAGRSHFFALAARAMRRVLVDHARAQSAEKRGGGAKRLSLTDAKLVSSADAPEVLAVHQALAELEKQDQRKAQVIELNIFGGLTYAEIAQTLEISDATVHRDLRLAKAWLARHLGEERA